MLLTLGAVVFLLVKPTWRDPLYHTKANAFASVDSQQKPAVRIVLLGSSRTNGDLQGSRMEAMVTEATGQSCVAYNFGSPAQGPLASRIYLERLLAQGLRPDVVSIEIFPLVYHDADGAPAENSLTPVRLSYSQLDLMVKHGFSASQTRGEWWRATLNPWSSYRFVVLGKLRPAWVPVPVAATATAPNFDGRGWQGFDADPSVGAQQCVEQRRQAMIGFKSTMDKVTFQGQTAVALRELLRVTKANGIRTLLVCMPEASEFRALMPQQAEASLQRMLADLKSEFGTHVIDARTWVPDESFSDPLHVRSFVAKGFTDRYTREAILPLLSARE